MNKRTCTMPECNNKHLAKGLCGTHYNRTLPNRHAKKMVACAWCGTEVAKQSGGGRKYGQACSNECRGYIQRPYSRLPADHWALWFGKASVWKAPTPSNFVFVSCSCVWCGQSFIYQAFGQSIVSKHCSARCQRRAAECRRGKKGPWITAKRRLALYERDQWTCQLCDGPVDKSLHYSDDWAPSLDHITPRSKQIVPDHSDANLRLAHRWCNAVLGDGTYYTEHDLAA